MSNTPEDEIAAAPSATVRVWRLTPIFVWAIVFLLFLFFLKAWTLCLLGLLAALCIAALLRPLLKKLPGPRALRGFLLGLVPIAVCGGLVLAAGWMLVDRVRQELSYLPELERHMNAWLASVSHGVGMSQAVTISSVLGHLRGGADLGFVGGAFGAMTELAIGAVFVFVGTIYLLAEHSEQILPPVLGLLPAHRRRQAHGFIAALEPRLRWWLAGAIVTATIIGVTSLIGFWLVGLQLWIPLAILAGLSEFVPTIGPALVFLAALAVAATQGPTYVMELGGLYAAVHILESYILIPLVYKEAVRIPPIVTLFTVVLWGEILGIGGLLLAVPINLFLWTAAEHFLSADRSIIAASPAGAMPAAAVPDMQRGRG